MTSHRAPLESVEVTELAYYASYFINGDGSGLEADELAKAAAIETEYASQGLYFVDCDEESHFGMPDHGELSGDVLKYDLIHRRSKSVHSKER